MVTGMRTPRIAYQHGEELSLSGWDAQGGELPYRRLHVETSLQATLLGRGPGERGGAHYVARKAAPGPIAKSSFKLQAAVDAFRGVPQGRAAGA